MRLILFFLFGCNLIYAQHERVVIKVEDERGRAAEAMLIVENAGDTIYSLQGEFTLKLLRAKTTEIKIIAPFFKTTPLIVGPNNFKTFYRITLKPYIEEIEAAVIRINRNELLDKRTPYTIERVDFMNPQHRGNPSGIMGELQHSPGVYSANFGQGIAKPIVRGLGFSRVVTVYQHTKLENHQWGADHGLGLNDLGVGSVEIIKGPASVLYGSGALGGVLLVKDDETFLENNHWNTHISSHYHTASLGQRITAGAAKKSAHALFYKTEIAYESHADYRAGGGRVIGNSRFNNTNFRLHLGIDKPKFYNKLSFTLLNQALGIIEDDELINSIATTRSDRSKQLPFQDVQDRILTYSQKHRFSNNELSINISHHLNERKEIESEFDEVDLGLRQNNSFFDVKYRKLSGDFKYQIGSQWAYLDNKNMKSAQEFLLPNSYFLDHGYYFLLDYAFKNTFLQTALRYDQRRITAQANTPELVAANFILPGNPEDRTLRKTLDGFSASLGVSHQMKYNQQLKFNISTGFRAPDVAELFSNGPHPGTNRFEIGNLNFNREQSLQLDASYRLQKNRWKFNVSLFQNWVDDFIFFAFTGERQTDSNLEIWAYQQTDARLYGAEVDINYQWVKGQLSSRLRASLVRGDDRNSDKPLSFMPPHRLNLSMQYTPNWAKDLSFSTTLRMTDDQNRPGMNEERTSGFTLVDLSLSHQLELLSTTIIWNLAVVNLFDVNYVEHLSILRSFNIPSAGRNLSAGLQIML
ncbi:MAG: TonB-dependent receptor [Flavobacteriaceae bacterium]|nr:TonB-dependent receptor [Flavobacteriaceae bacterium]